MEANQAPRATGGSLILAGTVRPQAELVAHITSVSDFRDQDMCHWVVNFVNRALGADSDPIIQLVMTTQLTCAGGTGSPLKGNNNLSDSESDLGRKEAELTCGRICETVRVVRCPGAHPLPIRLSVLPTTHGALVVGPGRPSRHTCLPTTHPNARDRSRRHFCCPVHQRHIECPS